MTTPVISTLSDQQLRRSITIAILLTTLLPPFVGGSLMGLVGFYPMPEFYLIFFSYTGPYVLAALLTGLALAPRAYRFIVHLTQLERALAAATAQRVFARLPWYLLGAVTLYSIGGALSADFSLDALGIRSYKLHQHLYNQFGLIPVVLITVFPIFFYFIDRLGRYLGPRGVSVTAIPLWLKLLMLGIVTPLLIDSLLLGYYFNRTGFFQWETLALWFSLLALAAGGTWLAWRSLHQGLAPLERFIAARNGSIPERARANLLPLSLDELGVLTAHYADLLSTQQQLSGDLQRTQLLANSVIDNAGALVLVLDPEGRIVRFNHACEKLSGYAFAEIEGKFPWDTFLPAEDAESIRKNAFETLVHNSQAMAGQYTNEWLSKNGERHMIEWSNTLLLDADGQMNFMVCVGTDVTEKNKIAQRLQEQATIIDQIHDAVVSTDLDALVTSWNKGAERMFGYAASEMLGRPIAQLYPLDQLSTLLNEGIASLRAEESHVAEVTMQRKNGERFYGYLTLSMLYDANHQPLGMISYMMDITKRKVAEEALRANNQIVAAVLDTTPVMIAYLDPDMHFVRVNAAYAAADHKQPEFFIGKNYFALFPNPQHEIIFRRVAETGEPHVARAKPFEYASNPEPGPTHLDWTLVPVKNDAGRVTGLVLSLTNVTDRIQALETAERSEQELMLLTESLETRVLQRTAEVQLQNRRNEIILNTTPDGFFSADAKGCIRIANPAFCAMLGYDEAEMLQLSIPDIEANERPQDVAAHMQRVIAHGHDRFDTRHRRKNGSMVDVEISVNLVDIDGEQLFYAFVRDITLRKRSEAALMHARDEAERANKTKSEFLSRMSHELRTPMNAILGFAQVLELESIQPEQMDFVHEIHRAGDHLLELINELLDLSRIEAGKLALQVQALPLDKVLAQALQITQSMMSARQIVLRNHCDPTLQVQADSTRLCQILVNLLSNAAKYNHAGGRISITCHPGAEGRLRIAVADTGPGIAQDKQALLFRPFERLGAELGEVEGAGIGLALSKQLAELMGATLGVESSPGIGSTFWVELPLAPSKQTAVSSAAAPSASADTPRYTVLYVEDNAANLKVVQAMLRRQPDVGLISATNGEYGLELARRYRPEVILLDINLPDMNGYAVLSALKADAATRAIPVLALTADAMPIDVARGLKAGFHRYLTKPIKASELIAAINNAAKLPPGTA